VTHSPLWRQIQRHNFTNWQQLLSFLALDIDPAHPIVLTKSKFSLNLPKRLAEKMEKKNWNDPILRQFLPTLEELRPSPLFVVDPVADELSRKAPKLLHKYQGRALLVCTSACAMHCRYCFRQHFEYETQDKFFQEELAAIAADSSISEVLLSGGDPLSLSDAQLHYLLNELDRIPHLKRIRFHTRFPVGIPERIDDSFVNLLAHCTKQIIFIVHSNHPRELDEEIFSYLNKIQRLGIPILTQSVLLKGVNDDVNTLKTLFELLADHAIIPAYLHQLDRVQGAAHFEVDEELGKQIMSQLQALLPGYAVPKYVREIPQRAHKTQIHY
jgi:EF-P beta-lysylation protein EpmB